MDNEKMNLWRQRIAKCQKSNLTVTEWCAQHQLSKGTYYYWYKKIVQQDNPENNIPVFADVTPVLIKEASVSSTDLTISWNQLQINVSNTKEAELAAVFISKLRSLHIGVRHHEHFVNGGERILKGLFAPLNIQRFRMIRYKSQICF